VSSPVRRLHRRAYAAPLARIEGQIAINTLLRRARALRLAVAPEALRWRRGLALRGLEALPVSIGALDS
jgi:cytochrome P450